MIRSVISVKTLKNFQLLLTFKGGQQRVFDMKPHLQVGLFAALSDPEVFNTVRVSFDTIVWANGADIDPESLFNGSIVLKSTPGRKHEQKVD